MKVVEATGRGFALGPVPEGEVLLAFEADGFVRVEGGVFSLMADYMGVAEDDSPVWRARFAGREENAAGVEFSQVWGEAEAEVCPSASPLVIAGAFCEIVVDDYLGDPLDFIARTVAAAAGDPGSQAIVWVYRVMLALRDRVKSGPHGS